PIAGNALFAVCSHAISSLTSQVEAARMRETGPLLKAAAFLSPLPGVSAGQAERAPAPRRAEELSRPYCAAALTSVPSVIAVTELKRRWRDALHPDDPVALEVERHATPTSPEWRRPRFLTEVAETSATDRGTFTHLLLEQLDLSAPC